MEGSALKVVGGVPEVVSFLWGKNSIFANTTSKGEDEDSRGKSQGGEKRHIRGGS